MHFVRVVMKDGTERWMLMPHEQAVPEKLAQGLIAQAPDWYVAVVEAEFAKWIDGDQVASWSHTTEVPTEQVFKTLEAERAKKGAKK